MVQLLQFGFPKGYKAPIPTPTIGNHPSANNNAAHLEAYIDKELKNGAMLSPFPAPPFYPLVSGNPLLTRPKKDVKDRTVIIDLSWPPPSGHSVNGEIPRTLIWGSTKKCTCRHMADLIKQTGNGAYLYCRDIARAYHQPPLDLADWLLVCFVIQSSYYADISLPFGLH